MLIWFVAIVTTVILLRVFLRYNVATCNPKADLSGKVVIVTGANSGIGFHTAKQLAGKGAKIILACRNEEKGMQARDQIIKETGNKNIMSELLDLASLTSVRKFCEGIRMKEKRLDVLVNNAGVYGLGDKYTEDGIIEAMQVNLFAPMLLTDLLLPLLKESPSSRIVNVTSLLHYFGEFRMQKVNKAGCYGDLAKYCNGKLGNVAFTVELARRLWGSGVTVTACHPGIAPTTIIKSNLLVEVAFAALCWMCRRSAEEAAATSVHLSACAGAECGAFYVDCARWPAWNAQSAHAARDLWTSAELLMNCKLENMAYPCSVKTTPVVSTEVKNRPPEGSTNSMDLDER